MTAREEVAYKMLWDLARNARYYLHFHEHLTTRWRSLGFWFDLTGFAAGSGAMVTAFASYPLAAGCVGIVAMLATGWPLVARPSDNVQLHGELVHRYMELDSAVEALCDRVHSSGYTTENLAKLDELKAMLASIRAS